MSDYVVTGSIFSPNAMFHSFIRRGIFLGKFAYEELRCPGEEIVGLISPALINPAKPRLFDRFSVLWLKRFRKYFAGL